VRRGGCATLAAEPTIFGTGWQEDQSTTRARRAPELVELLANAAAPSKAGSGCPGWLAGL
jgi:hypothetical protein